MQAPSSYQYAVVRIVPRVDRDEFVNAGVVVFSPQHRFLEARIQLDETRLRALWPSIDIDGVKRHLESFRSICAGDTSAGPMAAMSQSERFHWLTAPRSTMIQVSPVRIGVSEHPATLPEHLANELIAVA